MHQCAERRFQTFRLPKFATLCCKMCWSCVWCALKAVSIAFLCKAATAAAVVATSKLSPLLNIELQQQQQLPKQALPSFVRCVERPFDANLRCTLFAICKPILQVIAKTQHAIQHTLAEE